MNRVWLGWSLGFVFHKKSEKENFTRSKKLFLFVLDKKNVWLFLHGLIYNIILMALFVFISWNTHVLTCELLCFLSHWISSSSTAGAILPVECFDYELLGGSCYNRTELLVHFRLPKLSLHIKFLSNLVIYSCSWLCPLMLNMLYMVW